MANENRFSSLMGGLKGSDEPASKPAKVEPKKQRRKSPEPEQKAPTTKAKSDPKIRRLTDRPLAKSKDPTYEKATFYLEKDLTHEMRIYAATKKVEMSDIVSVAVTQYLKRHPLE